MAYKKKGDLEKNSIILNTSRNIEKAQRWIDKGRQVYVVGRNGNGIVLNFHPLCDCCRQTKKLD